MGANTAMHGKLQNDLEREKYMTRNANANGI
nr:MAG TPA: hypothetical protein [Caudoviricetes sp.]